MEARILKWQEMAKNKISSTEEFESIRRESMKRAEEIHVAENIQKLIGQVPLRFRHKSFSDYKTEFPEQIRVKKIAERFVETFQERSAVGTCVIFLGNPGTGKTLLSLIIYQQLARVGYRVHYESSLQFLKVLQEKRYESSVAFQSMLEYYRRPNLLILDEVTESVSKDGSPSEYDRKLLFDVINARYEKMQGCTLVISNRNKEELAKRLGQPMSDRLSENNITLTFGWNSYRQT